MSIARPDPHPNRESWLNDVAGRLRPAFVQLDTSLPERLRIAIGFPSTGRRAKATGECWDSAASTDATFEILVRPDLAEAEGALALPHARLDADREAATAVQDGGEAAITTRPRKQANRHVKCACLTCGYVARTARKWLDQVGPPHCPQHGPMLAEATTPVLSESHQGAVL